MMIRLGLSVCLLACSALSAPAAAKDPMAERLGRCTVVDDAPIYMRVSESLPRPVLLASPAPDRGRALPAVMVEGWRPQPGAIGALLAQLAGDAGFSVSVASSPVVRWDGRTAPLQTVVADLARQANLDWHYDGRTLSLRPVAAAPSISRLLYPRDRDARLALVDMVVGHDPQAVVRDEGMLTSQGTRLQSALAGLSDMVVFDVVFLRARPNDGRFNWDALSPRQRLVSDAGGRFVLDGSLGDLVTNLQRHGDVVADGRQTVGGPDGWSLVVPQEQCGNGRGSVTIEPRRAGDGVSIALRGAGVDARLDQVPLGAVALAAASRPTDGWISMVAVRPRVVAIGR